MTAGTLGFGDQRENEFHALRERLKEAYYKGFKKIILETYHVDAYWELFNFMVLGGCPQYAHVLWQLNQRKADRNYKCE